MCPSTSSQLLASEPAATSPTEPAPTSGTPAWAFGHGSVPASVTSQAFLAGDGATHLPALRLVGTGQESRLQCLGPLLRRQTRQHLVQSLQLRRKGTLLGLGLLHEAQDAPDVEMTEKADPHDAAEDRRPDPSFLGVAFRC